MEYSVQLYLKGGGSRSEKNRVLLPRGASGGRGIPFAGCSGRAGPGRTGPERILSC